MLIDLKAEPGCASSVSFISFCHWPIVIYKQTYRVDVAGNLLNVIATVRQAQSDAGRRQKTTTVEQIEQHIIDLSTRILAD